ncbi:MAG: aspartate aminotransferase family protein [Acidimicrobiia bacterium]|nr:aspartate aminotransferase family protein [Acidimicrobiia bacterium]
MPHMSPEEFRRHGYEVIDWITDYMKGVESLPVQPSVEPGEIRKMLPDSAPEEPEAFADIMADLDRVVVPGLLHWQSPNFFGFFPVGSSPPSVLADFISTGLGVNGITWASSPALTEVESQVLDWLADLLGLPETWKTTGPGGGVIQLSASNSSHISIVAARHRAGPGPDLMVAYTSSQSHSSIEKGARVAGIGHVRLIETDAEFAMRPAALQEAIDRDRAAGLQPMFVCSTVGTTGTTAVDPVAEIGAIARAEGLWHHVDAAYAGTAMICPELRYLQPGLETVDSYVVNPHKWMLVSFDCSVLYVADRDPLIDALDITPSYLRAAGDDEVIMYRNWHVSLGRRFRALKLWFVLRSYGAEAIRGLIRKHIGFANDLAARLEADERFEVIAPHPLALVCFRHIGGNEPTRALADAVNSSGKAYLTSASHDDRWYIRISTSQANTEQRHIDQLWSLIDELA